MIPRIPPPRLLPARLATPRRAKPLTYNPALCIAGAACLVAAIAVMAIPRPQRESSPSASQQAG